MTKPFYSGGFLYNPRLQKILLHKRDAKTKNNPSTWAFFGGLSKNKEKPLDTFIREIYEEIGIKLKPESIKKLTEYFNPDFDTQRYVFFAEVDEGITVHLSEGQDFDWFTISDAIKLNLTKRARQDLLVFQQNIKKVK